MQTGHYFLMLMKAIVYEKFGGPLALQEVPDPRPPEDGVVISVGATGICRSDWHGWQGHDDDISLPHVPGHELAGAVVETGKNVRRWRPGDRVTLPFCVGCGRCAQCVTGNQQVCDQYFQPGFTGWGSFAPLVAIPHADFNLVELPEEMDFVEAAILGCRFITSFRAVVDQGRGRAGEWLVVHGCGGVGLSAIMIGKAQGMQVLAVDITADKLLFARSAGADAVLNAREQENIPAAVKAVTEGGAHLSIDALGSTETCTNSLLCLRKRGRHVQVGLMAGRHTHPPLPMGPVIADELEIIGSHGMPAHRFPDLLAMIRSGALQPRQLLGKTVALSEAPAELAAMGAFSQTGVSVIDRLLD